MKKENYARELGELIMEITNTKTFHIDGMGGRRNGRGAAYGWIRIETGKQRICVVNGLTEHEAEYQALLGVLKYLAPGSRATIFTHSDEVWGVFTGPFPDRDRKMANLVRAARRLIREKKLKIRIRYIFRENNQAVFDPSYRSQEDHDGDACDEGDADFG
jgi:ribonuclease HI